jgi:hypothetical protein
MVLSTTKRTSSISSITNQNQGGGNKKMGLTPQIGVNQWSFTAYKNGGNIQPLNYLSKNRFKIFANQNLPVGFRQTIRPY